MILTLNSGSSSLKFQVWEDEKMAPTVSGEMQHFNTNQYALMYRTGAGNEQNWPLSQEQYELGGIYVLSFLNEVLDTDDSFELIIHRFVHGGEQFHKPVALSSRNWNEMWPKLEKLANLAPLHNPPVLKNIIELHTKHPYLIQVITFDTSFFHTLDPEVFLYPIAIHNYQEYGLRRYGFHGLSHQYAAQKVIQKEQWKTDDTSLKHIACHLGGGCSIAAIKNGIAIDTSFGFDPQSGLMMAHRAGDIDSGALLKWIERSGKSLSEIEDELNHGAGLLGLSGISANLKDLLELESTNPHVKMVISMYKLHIIKYIGAMVAHLGGVDVITFTGGIGARSSLLRSRICSELSWLGVELEETTNAIPVNDLVRLNKPTSKVRIYSFPSNEEAIMVQEARHIFQTQL